MKCTGERVVRFFVCLQVVRPFPLISTVLLSIRTGIISVDRKPIHPAIRTGIGIECRVDGNRSHVLEIHLACTLRRGFRHRMALNFNRATCALRTVPFLRDSPIISWFSEANNRSCALAAYLHSRRYRTFDAPLGKNQTSDSRSYCFQAPRCQHLQSLLEGSTDFCTKDSSIASLLPLRIVAFASTAWGLWWVARKNSGSYRIQVLFGFTLFAWISWYALPYIGDM